MFKSTLQLHPAIRERVESAAQHQKQHQLRQKEQLERKRSGGLGLTAVGKSAGQQQSIKLASDFRAFIPAGEEVVETSGDGSMDP